MRARALQAVVLGLGLAGARAAVAGTCTISDLEVIVPSLDLAGTPAVAGLALPATVDEATGTFSLDLTDFPNSHFEIVVDNQLDFEPKVYTGTIDAAGNVFLPAVQMNLITVFGGGSTVTVTPDVTTGIETVKVTGTVYATQGRALDFSTGTLTLEGEAFLVGPPGSPGDLATGLHLVCTLSPIPDATKLPKGPVLTHASGKAKFAKPGGTGVVGDTLTKLALVFTPGAAAGDPGQGIFIELRDGAGTSVLLVQAKAPLQGKKAALVDKDVNGSTIGVVTGRRTNGADAAPLSGKLSVKQTKKALVIALREGGLDLSTLAAGPAVVTVQVGTVAASFGLTVQKTAKGLTLK